MVNHFYHLSFFIYHFSFSAALFCKAVADSDGVLLDRCRIVC